MRQLVAIPLRLQKNSQEVPQTKIAPITNTPRKRHAQAPKPQVTPKMVSCSKTTARSPELCVAVMEPATTIERFTQAQETPRSLVSYLPSITPDQVNTQLSLR